MLIRLHGLSLLPASARKPRTIIAACRRALAVKKAEGPGELNVVFVTRERMLKLNKAFLRHGHDTDVIAFDYDEAPGPDEPFGDVYVSAYQARVQARRLRHPVLQEILTLVVHGTLHLLGYEDGSPGDKAEMLRVQDQLLASKAPLGRACWS